MPKMVNLDPKIAQFAESSVPDRARALFLKAAAGNCPKSGAIKAKCQSCVGYEDMVDRIRECAAWRCPLWAFRPYQQPDPV